MCPWAFDGLKLKNKRYSIIYADPAWSYSDKAAAGKRGASFQYPVISMGKLKSFYMAPHLADDCVCFMWMTAPMMPEQIKVLRAWGFKFKTIAFTWVKRAMNGGYRWGMGNWTRCLSGDTKVYLESDARGVFRENIENIGEYNLDKIRIWTPSGWRRVLNWWKNGETEVNRISTTIGDCFCSDSHIWPYKHPIKRRNGESNGVVEHVVLDGTFDDISSDMDKVLVKDNGHSVNMLTSTRPIEPSVPIVEVDGFDLSEDLGWVIGSFVAKGNYGSGSSKNQIRFSLHSKEQHYSDRARSCIDNIGLFEKFIIGYGSHGERLNIDLLMNTSSSFRLSFLQGVLDGDGHMCDDGGRELVFCNNELIGDMECISRSLGIQCRSFADEPQMRGEKPCGKHRLKFYYLDRNLKVSLNGEDVSTVCIKSLDKHYCRMETYDIEVDGGYFVANDIVTHNSNPEYCILGVRGNPRRVSKSVHSVIDEIPGRHSEKPGVVRDRIVELIGDVPRLEMFARERVEGWDCWGFDVENDVEIGPKKMPAGFDMFNYLKRT